MVLVDLSTGELIAEPDTPATVLEPDSNEEALASAVGGNAGPIAIMFPSFADGRGFSLARILRDRLGFTGEIRAVGSLIPDQSQFLLRSGFDTAEIADPDAAETWRRTLTLIRHSYQPSARNPMPLRWNASTKAAAELDRALNATDDLAERIRLIAERIDGRIAFSTSVGLEDQVILQAIAKSGVVKAGADIDVFTLDTGRLFPEVLETIELSELRYRTRIRLVSPEAREVEELVRRDGVYGFRRSIENRKSCCEIRKVRPLNRALQGAQAWITGLRRDQSDARADVPMAEWDKERGLIKINPLADWSEERLNAYIDDNAVLVNPLHAQGFVSIGCAPCTRPIEPGEDPRAGRWWWEAEGMKECGMHVAESERPAAPVAQQEKAA
ncbi:MAG: phosphoadenylyl-sulfate reductase [Methyloceanibacter sp.]|nr:phosphoadenylyl-sulfate reductase [Methyloceanibacter sp.]